jgi:hypothetical protein
MFLQGTHLDGTCSCFGCVVRTDVDEGLGRIYTLLQTLQTLYTILHLQKKSFSFFNNKLTLAYWAIFTYKLF